MKYYTANGFITLKNRQFEELERVNKYNHYIIF